MYLLANDEILQKQQQQMRMRMRFESEDERYFRVTFQEIAASADARFNPLILLHYQTNRIFANVNLIVGLQRQFTSR